MGLARLGVTGSQRVKVPTVHILPTAWSCYWLCADSSGPHSPPRPIPGYAAQSPRLTPGLCRKPSPTPSSLPTLAQRLRARARGCTVSGCRGLSSPGRG